MSLSETYGSPAPVKAGHFTESTELLSEEEVRHRMSDISRRFESERQRLRNAYIDFAKREARVQLAITFMQPDLLYKKEAKDYVLQAKEKATKLTVADKEAIIMIELEEAKIEYDMAKFDCETSDSDFEKAQAATVVLPELIEITLKTFQTK